MPKGETVVIGQDDRVHGPRREGDACVSDRIACHVGQHASAEDSSAEGAGADGLSEGVGPGAQRRAEITVGGDSHALHSETYSIPNYPILKPLWRRRRRDARTASNRSSSIAVGFH